MQSLDPDLTTNMPKQLPKDFFIPDADYDATVNSGDRAQGINFEPESNKTTRDKNTKQDASRGVTNPDSKDPSGPAHGANPDEKNQYAAPVRGVNNSDTSPAKGIQYDEEGLPPGWVRQWDAK